MKKKVNIFTIVKPNDLNFGKSLNKSLSQFENQRKLLKPKPILFKVALSIRNKKIAKQLKIA